MLMIPPDYLDSGQGGGPEARACVGDKHLGPLQQTGLSFYATVSPT